jgi:type I restriction enzyme S subunit
MTSIKVSIRDKKKIGQQVLTKLGDVCRIKNGYAFESIFFSDNEGMPLIRIRDLKTNHPSAFFYGNFNDEYVVVDDDLLIGMDGEFRCYRWKGGPALLNQRVCQLLPNPLLIDKMFLYYAI